MFVEFFTYVCCMEKYIEKLKTKLTFTRIQILVFMIICAIEIYENSGGKLEISFCVWCAIIAWEVYLLFKHLTEKMPTN